MPAAFLFAVAFGQSLPVEASEAVRLERIRQAVAAAPAIVLETPRREGLVFRVTVEGRKPDRPIWDEWSAVPSYIRPAMPLSQYQFLQMVTPEQFRSGTLYPVGLPIGTLLEALGRRISAAHRRSQEARAREEVRQALDDVLACRADPTRPGC